MKWWSEFAAEQPYMVEAGRTLLYQFRVGLGYFATVRKDGGPRVHPVYPVIANGGLYAADRRNKSPDTVGELRSAEIFAAHLSSKQAEKREPLA
jgi:hypothetical protein